MDASTIFLAALILHLSLWVASEGKFDGTQGVVLPGSVFQIFRRTTLQQCRRLCVYSSRCLSVNWSSSTRECQLNSENGESLLVSDRNRYLPVQQDMIQQGHPCGNQPCSTDDMCIPVNTAKGHTCVRVGAFIPQTTDARMTPKTETTTTTAATTSAAPPTTFEVTTTTTTAPISTFTATAATTSAAPLTTLEVTTTTTTAPISTFTATAATTSVAPPTTLEVTTSTTTAPISTFTATAATTSAAHSTITEVTTTTTTTLMSTSTTLNGTTTSPEPTPSAPTSNSAATTTTAPYNVRCVTDIDCAVPPGTTCSGGVCICSIGYDMDETSVKCRRLTECTSFGSEFTLHVDKGIYVNDFQVLNFKTSAECEQLCLHSDTVCKSFEIYRNTCYLKKATWFDVDYDDHRGDGEAEHYQRRCNW